MSMNIGNLQSIQDFLTQEPIISTLHSMKQYYKDPQQIMILTSTLSPITGQPPMTSTDIMNILKYVHHVLDLTINLSSSTAAATV